MGAPPGWGPNWKKLQKVGLIIEAGYRDWTQVHTEGEIRKWPRNLVEVINESR
jgi:hypothetical protein